jgi:diphthamide synthase (EF-2-diphthine--ammonia ligase)
MSRRVVLSWSSGKDSAWTLHVPRQHPDLEVVGLLTTFNDAAGRVAMHAVRRTLVEAQAAAARLPLWHVPCRFPVPTPSMRNACVRRSAAHARKA